MSNSEEQLNVSDDVLAVCAMNAALKTEGVIGTAGGFSNMLNRNILGKDLIAKGIKVVQDDGVAEIDVHVIVEYGCKIPAVAWDIQENVKNRVQAMTGVKVKAVNIHIQGVEINDEK